MAAIKLTHIEKISQELSYQIPIHDGLIVWLSDQLARAQLALRVFLTYGKRLTEESLNEDQR